jgi:hypothetical protein
MNADVTPMNADNSVSGWNRGVASGEDALIGTLGSFPELSAFIGVTSAFIGVPKTLASVSHR